MPEPAASPVSLVADGVQVRLRVTPRSRRPGTEGLAPEADGGVALRVAVAAAPEDGKANDAVIRLLAGEWGVARSALSVALGAAGRRKVLHVAGDPARLRRQIEDWLARRGGGAGASRTVAGAPPPAGRKKRVEETA